MSNFAALIATIQANITTNGNEEITGAVLQDVLKAMVQALGTEAINNLETALGNEVGNRQNADGTLQNNIDAEALRAGTAEGVLQTAINGIKSNIDNGYVYAGIATPSGTPASGKVFYLAVTAGTYTNYGALVVTQGINILKYNGTAWSQEQLIALDNTPTPSSSGLVKSGGVFEEIMTNGSAFDLTVHNSGTTYADLSAALTAMDSMPAAYKKGGMSIKFVQTSDNKYVQYRLMADEWTIDVSKWSFMEGDIYSDNPEYVEVTTDANKKVIESIKKVGKKTINLLLEIPALSIKGFLLKTINNPEWSDVVLNKNNRIVEGTKKNSTKILYSLQCKKVNTDELKVNKEVSLSKEATDSLRVLINEEKTVLVDKDGNGDFTTLIAACLDSQNYDKYTIYVNAGVYDLATEYKNMFGSSYFDDYTDNYNGYVHGRIDAGLFLFPNVSLIGIGLAEIRFSYTGSNSYVRQYFSLLNTTKNNRVENLTLRTTMSNPNRYIIHDDFGGVGGDDAGTNIFKNLIMDAGNCSAIMGCGMGAANTYIVEQCLLIGNNTIPSISYHNNSNPDYPNAKNTLIVNSCKGVGKCVVITIGPSQEKTLCVVSNCEFSEITKEASQYDTYGYDNIELVKFNNTETNV